MNRQLSDCRTAGEWISRLLSGEITEAERRGLDLHLAVCERCADILSQALFEDSADDISADDVQIDMVLARTSGSACPRAQQLIFKDDNVEDDATLKDEHLMHCPDCRALAETWEWVSPVLESMAVMNPGREFTESVLLKTSGRPIALPVGERIREWVKALGDLVVTRPRFALEFSYVATLILILAFGPIRAPIKVLREHTPVLSHAGVVATIYEEGTQHLVTFSQTTWHSGSRWTGDRWNRFMVEYRNMKDRGAPPLNRMKKHGHALKDSIKKRDINRAVPVLHSIWVDCRQTWHEFRSDPIEGDSHGKQNAHTN